MSRRFIKSRNSNRGSKKKLSKGQYIHGIPAFRDFRIRDPRYFVIHFRASNSLFPAISLFEDLQKIIFTLFLRKVAWRCPNMFRFIRVLREQARTADLEKIKNNKKKKLEWIWVIRFESGFDCEFNEKMK